MHEVRGNIVDCGGELAFEPKSAIVSARGGARYVGPVAHQTNRGAYVRVWQRRRIEGQGGDILRGAHDEHGDVIFGPRVCGIGVDVGGVYVDPIRVFDLIVVITHIDSVLHATQRFRLLIERAVRRRDEDRLRDELRGAIAAVVPRYFEEHDRRIRRVRHSTHDARGIRAERRIGR